MSDSWPQKASEGVSEERIAAGIGMNDGQRDVSPGLADERGRGGGGFAADACEGVVASVECAPCAVQVADIEVAAGDQGVGGLGDGIGGDRLLAGCDRVGCGTGREE
jgi:hypothetical protein